MSKPGFRLLACFLSTLIIHSFSFGQTMVVKNTGGYTLMRNGSPYYVKGVGGEVNLEKVKEIGGNSIRTWGSDDAGRILDAAQKHGLTVMLGLWLIPERQGFDYNNKEKVEEQLVSFKAIIDKYKHHPALLMWGIGNELDLGYTNPIVWKAVEEIAKYIHQTDPDHPATTVTAGIDSIKIGHILKMAPDVDILCVNTYGDIHKVPTDIVKFGWTGPYMITEWGPNGFWESPKTSWNVSIEQTSTEKKRIFYERYSKYIDPFQSKCLGSYAFFWGTKQEYTETWFGLFSRDNLPTEPIDALELVFTGKYPVLPAPAISSITIDGKAPKDNIRIKTGREYPAQIIAGIGVSIDKTANPPNKRFEYQWKVLAESTDKKSGGDAEKEAREIGGLIRDKGNGLIDLKAPSEGGAYRLFVRVLYNGKVAYANIPFYVETN